MSLRQKVQAVVDARAESDERRAAVAALDEWLAANPEDAPAAYYHLAFPHELAAKVTALQQPEQLTPGEMEWAQRTVDKLFPGADAATGAPVERTCPTCEWAMSDCSCKPGTAPAAQDCGCQPARRFVCPPHQIAALEAEVEELNDQHAYDCDQFNRIAQEVADANAQVRTLREVLEAIRREVTAIEAVDVSPEAMRRVEAVDLLVYDALAATEGTK